MKYLILFVLLIPNLCFAGDWDKTDKYLYGSLLVLNTLDYLQTKQIIIPHNGIGELNPVIKNNPKYITSYFVGCALLGYLIADRLSPEKRKTFLIISNSIEIGCVAHNYKAGVRFKF